MTDYYARQLSGRRLQRCYEVASPRVRRYLAAEIDHTLGRLRAFAAADVLELGCGYGRVALRLTEAVQRVRGIDNAPANVALARELAAAHPLGDRVAIQLMDAAALGFADEVFDAVVCVQNGICAFRVDPELLVREALRVLRPGGLALFSTYADAFWPHRLAWFEAQAAAGLMGPVDRAASGDGVVVCRDGFRAGRLTPAELRALAHRCGEEPLLTEVDAACVVCELVRGQRPR